MTKKKVGESETKLRVLGVSIQRPASVPASSREGLALLEVAIEVENASDQALYVWTTRREYSYDAAKHLLTVRLAEPPESLPPNVKILSDHASTPGQALVEAGTRVTIEVPVPAFTRRLTPGKGLGQTFAEDPIGAIDKVELYVQFGATPIKYRTREQPSDFRSRLRAHGEVVTATLTPTFDKEK
jgi:hypothetical protein